MYGADGRNTYEVDNGLLNAVVGGVEPTCRLAWSEKKKTK